MLTDIRVTARDHHGDIRTACIRPGNDNHRSILPLCRPKVSAKRAKWNMEAEDMKLDENYVEGIV